MVITILLTPFLVLFFPSPWLLCNCHWYFFLPSHPPICQPWVQPLSFRWGHSGLGILWIFLKFTWFLRVRQESVNRSLLTMSSESRHHSWLYKQRELKTGHCLHRRRKRWCKREIVRPLWDGLAPAGGSYITPRAGEMMGVDGRQSWRGLEPW